MQASSQIRPNKTASTPYRSLNARFSRCRQYRYSLTRSLPTRSKQQQGRVLFIGLNPSTADHRRDDPTIRRCVGFASEWGFSELAVVNLFAFRATYPEDLKQADDPIGKRNDYWIRRYHREADLTIACWGNDGEFMQRADKVKTMLTDLYCLNINRSLQPAHPLYQRASEQPKPMASLLKKLAVAEPSA